VVCSILEWSPPAVIAHYDDRGACETEIQADKLGRPLERRRQAHLAAQEALILLTDVAHNLLAWARLWMFPDAKLAQYGPLRLTADVLCLPGHLVFEQGRLVQVQLNALHSHAAEVAVAIWHLFDHFENPQDLLKIIYLRFINVHYIRVCYPQKFAQKLGVRSVRKLWTGPTRTRGAAGQIPPFCA